MSTPPSVAVVIPWCDRASLARALPRNRAALDGHEVWVVCCGGDRARFAELLAEHGWPGLRALAVPAPRFSKGLAVNLAVARTDRDAVLVLDADVVLRPGTIARMQAALARGVVTLREVRDEPPAPPSSLDTGWTFTVRLPDGRATRVETGVFRRTGRSAPGLAMVRTDHFRAVGGMRSDLVGWGWEDIDLLLRLQLQLGLRRVQVGVGTHLAHPPVPGAARSEAENRALCLTRYAAGDLLGTLDADVFAWRRPPPPPAPGFVRLPLPPDLPNADFDVWVDRAAGVVRKVPVAPRLRELSEPARLQAYRAALLGAADLPHLGRHIAPVLSVDDDGSYTSPWLDGPGVQAADAGALDALLAAFSAWEAEHGPLPGDWHPNNLVLHGGRLVNVDVEGFWHNADGARVGLSEAGRAALRRLREVLDG